MVKLTKIYTRGGDTGQTSLGDGKRRPKQDVRVAAFGTVDEANAALGLARLTTEGETDAMLGRIQDDLFDLGADLCVPGGDGDGDGEDEGRLRIVQAQIDRLEREIDAMNAALDPLESFILPGGAPAAAHLHLARTIVRRAERLVAELAEGEAVNPLALRFINRLSDHLFVLGRAINKDTGNGDRLWRPGANR